MGKDKVLSTRVNEDLYEKAKDSAEDCNMSLSEWLEDTINDHVSDTLTAEDVENMDWDEKIGVVDEYELSIDPDNYDSDEEFSEAIIDELGLESDQDESNPRWEWLIFVPFVGLAIWGISLFSARKQI